MSDEVKGAAFRKVTLLPGLYFVATPIGAARDITLRALDILASADVLLAEDTRTLKRLMELHGVPLDRRPVISYHDHNGAEKRPGLMQRLEAGQTLAYASEAGTPLVADPGYQLGRSAVEFGHPVFSAPGASAVLAALTVSGLPSDRFEFLGFAPPKGKARQKFLASIEEAQGTTIVYEAPGRVHQILGELVKKGMGDRETVLCRELTKRFEDVRRGSLETILTSVQDDPPRGEIVLLFARQDKVQATPEAIDAALGSALVTMGVKDASAQVAKDLDLPKRDVYQRALALKEQS